jgi:uncharacterized protein (DUF169 family)
MRLEELLGLDKPPIAIAFLDEVPPGLERVATAEAAGCGYWRRAQDGAAFYTEAADHKGCPVGAHTHGVPLDADDTARLSGLLGTMIGLEYLREAELPAIPRRDGAWRFVAYAPLGEAPFAPDVVLVRADVRRLMLLAEAAAAVGVAAAAPTMGRPTCAVIPLALSSQRTSASFGCVGNRVYTGLGDGEGWFAVPASALAAVEERLGAVVRANEALARLHEERARG